MKLFKILAASAALVLASLAGAPAQAADPLKIGLILPMSGPFASTGKQIDAAVKLYIKTNGDTVAGRKVEVILKDDTGTAPDLTKRLAQELIVNDKVDILAGFGLTPLAFAAAPLSEEAKKPMIVMAAATSAITTKSPYILRTSFTLPQVAAGIADWAAKNKIKKVYILVTDYGPGIDAETQFKKTFAAGGGEVVGSARIPLRNPDYGPFMQRAKDAAPDAVFAFVPSGEGTGFMKEFAERGLAKAGIKLIATGDVLDDDILDAMGDTALGVISSHHYSAAHKSKENLQYVADFQKANPSMRPNFMSLGGWDGMDLIYQVLKKTNGDATGDKFVAAAKGMSWMSPRGQISIDADTRDITQTVYIRKVEKVDGHLYNVEFDQIKDV
ncbi:MAG TPA: ABC transporter substrate-binding protein, partial [Rhizomicrobium sp.]|nr:ABC transporter substrate-binding protein [Rhizomicrobium sp.]